MASAGRTAPRKGRAAIRARDMMAASSSCVRSWRGLCVAAGFLPFGSFTGNFNLNPPVAAGFLRRRPSSGASSPLGRAAAERHSAGRAGGFRRLPPAGVFCKEHLRWQSLNPGSVRITPAVQGGVPMTARSKSRPAPRGTPSPGGNASPGGARIAARQLLLAKYSRRRQPTKRPGARLEGATRQRRDMRAT